ncbi:MAG: Rpn family recombination-promoting nuclease/putative transposase [Candidatus Cloacimonetes bacterium]|nr:Rpn family recombination-promoting nuclease/putative transposase [Candidatus Cloacimonadota bacterium]
MRADTFVSPFTDFGFKKLFGEEYNKDLLLDFLNQLLQKEQGNIVSLTYLKNEQLGRHSSDRRAIFDLYCENERGEKFIVEIQKTKQKFFKDRTLYYSSFPIIEQGQVGAWDFELQAVYTVAILDFVFDEDKDLPEKYRHDIKLSDIETKKVFYDKLTFIYLEMPKFNKSIDELNTRFDKWLYILKNLERLHQIPDKFKDRIFEKLFKAAEIAQFSKDENMAYQDSLKVFRDLKNSFDTAIEEGHQKGLQKGLEQGRAEGEIRGKLSAILDFYKEGILDKEAAEGKMSAFLGSGFDELVKDYLLGLK